jgi:hypothetical protein
MGRLPHRLTECADLGQVDFIGKRRFFISLKGDVFLVKPLHPAQDNEGEHRQDQISYVK